VGAIIAKAETWSYWADRNPIKGTSVGKIRVRWERRILSVEKLGWLRAALPADVGCMAQTAVSRQGVLIVADHNLESHLRPGGSEGEVGSRKPVAFQLRILGVAESAREVSRDAPLSGRAAPGDLVVASVWCSIRELASDQTCEGAVGPD